MLTLYMFITIMIIMMMTVMTIRLKDREQNYHKGESESSH
jgi:hypothetical protein